MVPAKMNHERIAKIWGIILEREITPEEVVACMVGLKLARLAEDISKDDSWVDIIGYAALVGRLLTMKVDLFDPENEDWLPPSSFQT